MDRASSSRGGWGVCVGAGPEQVPSIHRAQQCGMRVLALDGNPAAVGLDVADHGLVVDIADEASVVSAVSRYPVEMVVPAPLGGLLLTAGAINDALDLPGVSREQTYRCVDKAAFSETLVAAGLPTPRHVTACSERDILDALSADDPVILKPVRGSGSKGVVVITPDDQVEVLVREHLASRPPGEVTLVSEYVSGREVGLDVLVNGGTPEIVAIRDKRLTPLPYRQETALMLPACLDASALSSLHACVGALVAELGIDATPMHLDVIITPTSQTYVVDCAPRPSGMFISTKLVPWVTGRDLILDSICDLQRRDRINMTPSFEAAVLCMLPPSLSGDSVHAATHERPDMVFIRPLSRERRPTPVRGTADVLSRGLLLVGAETVAEAVDKADVLIRQIEQRGPRAL